MVRFLASLVFCAAALLGSPAAARPLVTENVTAELHATRTVIAPGETFTVVLRQQIREGWHTYWRNPGDAGEETKIAWTLPPGFEAGPIRWPVPEAIPFATLLNYGYSNEVLLPVSMTAPATLQTGQPLTLSADVTWVVCKDICILGEGRVTLTLQTAAEGRDDTTWAPRIAAAVAALPSRPEIDARIARSGRLSVALAGADAYRNFHFFPFSRDVIEAAAEQSPRASAGGVTFTLTPGFQNTFGQGPLEGLVAYEVREGGAWVRRGVEIVAQPSEEALAGAAPMALSALLTAIGLAFLGGLILNVMPCVLPVLSVKALAFAGGAAPAEARRQGVFYTIGVLATFLALAGLLIALREAGAAVGWGFQLQSPLVTSGLALLFFVIGLNLLGVFEVGGGAQNLGAGLAARSGDAGAFFTGALAVVAATPCTAPFMAGALGVALTQPAHLTLLIFAALALGFALPLAALHFAPAFQKLIPKPGAWMERVRNVLAFPMFGAAIWLAWVLTAQTGADGALALLSLAAAIGFALYVGRWGRAWLLAGLIVLAATGALMWKPLAGVESEAALAHEPWSPARVAELSNEGRGVFVNFTAAWCVTCQVNEALVFNRPAVAQAFAESNTAYLIADWTNRNAEIAAILDEHQWPGVPLYLYYPPGSAEPRVMPIEGFGERAVIAALRGETP
ncbi:MAG: protein-disulfide reductase DsbD family protein [Hyphomonadaceae bacterium]